MRNKQFLIKGNPVDPQKTYQLATLDMFTFGFYFPSFQRAVKTYYMPEFIRDVFEIYMKEFRPLQPL